MNEERSKEYQFGFDLGTYEDYVAYFGVPIGGSRPWVDYLDGKSAKEEIIRKDKFQLYKLDEFNRSLKELCDKYSVSLSFGCGCCDAGATCKDISFSLNE